MILHLLRMRRNVNRNVFNDRENVSATPDQSAKLAVGVVYSFSQFIWQAVPDPGPIMNE